MSKYELFTDDYVAELLAKDAKESSIRYSRIGLQAYAPSKPPANKPKPNTRFLRNIIKDTDNYNAAILAKEAAEARERLQDLEYNGPRRSQEITNGPKAIRKNQLSQIKAILGDSSTKRKTRPETNTSKKNHGAIEEIEMHERKSKLRKRDKDWITVSEHNEESRTCMRDENPRAMKDRRFKGVLDVLKERERQGESHKKRCRLRSRSPQESLPGNVNRVYDKTNSRSHNRHSTLQFAGDKDPRSVEPLGKKSQVFKASNHTRTNPETYSDSDPLDDVIGPCPAPIPDRRIRGRGNVSGASGIDSRFSVIYDPSADVQVQSDEENDWDQAMEAFRDRQKFREKGIERLRAAGFTEEEIQRLEKGGDRREQDVKWTKLGERREWDRGKILDSNGAVRFEYSVGGLNGNV